MKIAVCDDDIQCIAQVCALLEQWSQQKKIALTLYHFSDGDELLRPDPHLQQLLLHQLQHHRSTAWI